jgi:septal ring factor EnvC (AmiA/AmiB activator)
LFLLTAFLLLAPLSGQNKGGQDNKKKQKELEKQRKQKEEEIKLTRKLLNQTTSQKNKSLNQLRLLNRQIRIREELIQAVNLEISSLDARIMEKNGEIDALEEELELRKKEYADMLYVAYKNHKSFHPLIFYLSSSSFNQAVKRMSFVRELGASRTRQLEMIRSTSEEIENQVNELQQIRLEKSGLLYKKEEEKGHLEQDKTEENQLVKSLQEKEKELRKDLALKEKAAKELDEKIKKIIREEIERARKEEEARKKKEGTSGTTLAMTPEAAALSANFTSNRGKLPWPVDKGFILKGFGEHRHPTLPNVKTLNNGIDIVTGQGSSARAVFDGEIRAIFTVPGMQTAVMINHGEFFTVYTHLESVTVKKGDKIKTKQSIGKIYTDTEDNKTILHFELWKGSVKQDPEEWLFKF